MSASWVLFEKDLLNDPRVLRMASRLCHGEVTEMSRSRLEILGALTVFWCFADTHIGDDDTLACSVDNVNQIVGLADFCEILPPDWLQVLDANSVHLPGFLEHKRRAMDRTRQQRHRSTIPVTVVSRKSHATNVTKTNKPVTKKAPFDMNAIEGLDVETWKRWREYRLTNKPIKTPSLTSAARALAKFGDAQAQVVENSIASGYQGLFEPRRTSNGGTPIIPPKPLHTAEWAEARSRAAAIGFRAPWPLEAVGAYMTAVKFAETAPVNPRIRDLLSGALKP